MNKLYIASFILAGAMITSALIFKPASSQNAAINTGDNPSQPMPETKNEQVIKMNASASGYSPNYFKVKAGMPVSWEITDIGTSGCTNAVVAQGLFSDRVNLESGQTVVKKFTPTKPDKYQFSCWMGMVTGTIEVI